jgi:taurine dioxygenase
LDGNSKSQERIVVTITPNQNTLGAEVTDVDLAQSLSEGDFSAILKALSHHGVIWFPRQTIDAPALKAFSGRFGSLEINVANTHQEPGHPEVMILSNIKVDGKPIGLADAGQDWHTDMSYSKDIAFANVLYAIKVPRRNGQPLGNTEFADMYAAYDALPDDVRTRLAGATILHDFNKFWEEMRSRPGSTRPPLTEAQRRQKPPVSHPALLRHPISGRTALYANPGYAIRINGWPERESERMLAFLFDHQVQERFRYVHRWTEGDVLMWDNLATLHNAKPDYTADEHRLIKRCQVMADRVLDGSFSHVAALGGRAQ